jgi:hypothetical protein
MVRIRRGLEIDRVHSLEKLRVDYYSRRRAQHSVNAALRAYRGFTPLGFVDPVRNLCGRENLKAEKATTRTTALDFLAMPNRMTTVKFF